LSAGEEPLIRGGHDEKQERKDEQTGAAFSGHDIHLGNRVPLKCLLARDLPTSLENQGGTKAVTYVTQDRRICRANLWLISAKLSGDAIRVLTRPEAFWLAGAPTIRRGFEIVFLCGPDRRGKMRGARRSWDNPAKRKTLER
jgi:hypothetical protein